jgi:hypothetical protein
MNRLLFGLVLMGLATVSFSQMPTDSGTYPASAVTVTSGSATVSFADYGTRDSPRMMRVVSIAWTSDAAGSVSVDVPSQFGFIARVVTNPAAGTLAPADNYDVALNDQDGIDLFARNGADRDTASSEVFVPLIGDGATTSELVLMCGPSTLTVTDAGNAKAGVIRIYLK